MDSGMVRESTCCVVLRSLISQFFILFIEWIDPWSTAVITVALVLFLYAKAINHILTICDKT